MSDCWDILGIEPTKDVNQIKKRFRKLARTNHPDKRSGSVSDMDTLSKAKEEALRQASLTKKTRRKHFPRPYRETRLDVILPLEHTFELDVAEACKKQVICVEYSYMQEGVLASDSLYFNLNNWNPGRVCVFPGKGNVVQSRRGALNAKIQIQSPPDVLIEGKDVIIQHRVSLDKLISGKTFQVQTPCQQTLDLNKTFSANENIGPFTITIDGAGLGDGNLRILCSPFLPEIDAKDKKLLDSILTRKRRADRKEKSRKRTKFI